ncbi:MAG: SPOR domain-containing protein [Chitinophagaceae bacterium]|nr:SPOR domain-containing protein [Chitinophagaceae bacterium]
MKSFVVALLIFLPTLMHAQTGNIILVEDSGVQKVLKLYQTFATEKRAVNGFRVQLASNSNRTMVMDMKSSFSQEYPDVNSYLTYQQPQFKLRVGDFEKRVEANQFMEEIKSSFPSAFVVPDKILLKGIPW